MFCLSMFLLSVLDGTKSVGRGRIAQAKCSPCLGHAFSFELGSHYRLHTGDGISLVDYPDGSPVTISFLLQIIAGKSQSRRLQAAVLVSAVVTYDSGD